VSIDRLGLVVSMPWGRLALAAVASLLAGCTMCPDPYDYSGPVPNRSAPQNNFRARSNGIIPIGTRPMPWPPLVKQGGGADAATQVAGGQPGGDAPTLADPAVESAAATTADVPAEATSVLVSAVEADPCDVPPDAAAIAPGATDADVNHDAGADLELPPFVAAVDVPEEPRVEMPPLAETPGWRPRHAP
jgi:hypothetical protein